MAVVLDSFVQVIMEKLVDKAIGEIISILGVKSEVKNLQRNLEKISLLLVDMESKKIENMTINHWLGELRQLMYDVEDLLDDCHVQANIVASARTTSRRERIKARLRCIPEFSQLFSIIFRHKIGTRIKKINSSMGRLNSDISILQLLTSQPNVVKKVCRYNSSRKIDTCPIQLDSDIVGLDDDATKLVDRITGDNIRAHSIFAITGIPGIGKTTLARKVFNHDLIQNHFETIWICVSSNCHGEYLLREIVRSIKNNDEEEMDRGENASRLSQNELSSKVIEVVNGKRVFIVLDDIWDACIWEEFLRVPLYTGSMHSRILITTRNQDVAKQMKAVHMHMMENMLLSNGLSMLFKIVFEEENESDMNELKEIGMEIVEDCKSLPLAIKVVGGILKRTDRTLDAWKIVRSSRTRLGPCLPGGVQPGLLLSYEDLPSDLKQCFIYFSLFPVDFMFWPSTLVQMWIAEGLIKKENGKEMEDRGKEYYNELVARNILQELPEYSGEACKMHDLLRSLALFVSQNQYIYINPENINSISSIRYRHISFIGKEINKIPKEIMEHDHLRTLLLSGNPRIQKICPLLLSRLSRLKVLDLANTGIKILPDSLGELIHLKFLNISFTKLKTLPDSIKNLKNLETLKAYALKYLHRLPAGLVELNSLRHLALGSTGKQLLYMPIRMYKLKNLRTLNGFVVNDSSSNEGYQHTRNMKELRDLCKLTDLSIYNLERVANREEAEEAALENKTKLKYLKLSCAYQSETHLPTDEEIDRIEKVFAGIKTPKSLTGILIDGFFGKEFPSETSWGSLSQVTFLRLEDCRLVRQLPSLGDMPKLKILHIWDAQSVVELGSEFYGILKFPKLQELYVWRMSNLERMRMIKQGAFPCLKKLHIFKCPKLKSFPDGLQHATCLEQLVVEDAENFESIANLTSISKLTVKENPRLRSIENLPSLNTMSINNCSSLMYVKDVGKLNYLFISEAELSTLPQWLAKTTALKNLNVIGDIKLVLRTYQNAEDWNLIERCYHVEVRSHDGSKYMSYSKEPYRYSCDLIDKHKSGVSASLLTIAGSFNCFMDEE